MNCCDIQLGDLNRLITINKKVESADGQGGFTTNYELFKKPWCKITPKTGTEKKENGRLSTTQFYIVICRYFDGLTETMQGVYKSESLQIRSIVNIEERNEWLEIKFERKAKQQ